MELLAETRRLISNLKDWDYKPDYIGWKRLPNEVVSFISLQNFKNEVF